MPTETPYIAPRADLAAFNCPYCRAYAAQANARVLFSNILTNFEQTRCSHCEAIALWHGDLLIYPRVSSVPMPHAEMPDACKADYLEARSIASASPRGAAALLRLSVQKLMVYLGKPGKNIDADIKSLVQEGLSVGVQQALDVCRVVGNNAVHPGEIDVAGTPDIAQTLFDLVNFIVDDRISKPKAIDALFSALPDGARAAIAKRDEPKE